MKTLKLNFQATMALLLVVFAFAACSTDGLLGNMSTDVTAAEEEAMMDECEEGADFHAGFMLAEEMEDGPCENWKNRIPECATVTTSGESYPKTTTISFGDDCKDKHGRARNGKIVVVETDDMKNVGAKRTITFEHFGMENNTLAGTKTLENIGKNSAGNYVFKYKNTMNGSGERGDFERVSEGEMEWIKGFDTEDCYDNEIAITGGSTSTKDGETLGSRTIKEAIIRNFDCKYPLSGVVEINGPKGIAVIDFGDGTCDNLATVTKDGETKEINLDQRKHRKGGKKRRPKSNR